MKKLLFILLIVGVLIMLRPINAIIKDNVGNIIHRGFVVTGEVTKDNGNKSYDVKIAGEEKEYPRIFTLARNPDLAVGDKVRILYKNGCKELPIILPPVKPTAISLYENQIITVSNAYTNIAAPNKREAMPILAISNHNISQVHLFVKRYGNPGTVNIEIKAADGDKKPTGAVLSSGNFDGNTLSETGEWKEIEVSLCAFIEGNWYVVIVNVPGAGSYNYLRWYGTFENVYPDAKEIYSYDAGVNWYYGLLDFSFKIYG